MIRAEEWIDPASGQPHVGAALGMLLTAQAAATPDRPAASFGDRTWSFAELDAAANRRARDLVGAGVRANDRVILAMPNRVEYLECAFALWKIGAIPCPVSQRLAGSEFAEILTLADAAMVVGSPDLPVPASRLYNIDAPIDDTIDASPMPPAVSQPGKIANSGGSTGRPKLIVDPRPSSWGTDKEGCRRGPRLTLLNPAPLYHSGPFNTCTMALAQGTHIVCMEKFEAEQWLALVERHRVTYVYIVPTMMSRIARLPEAATRSADLSSIQTLLHMAAPCPPDIKRWWIDRLGPDQVWEVYGGTERIGVTTISGSEWLLHPGSVGRPPPGQDILIIGEDDALLPVGEIGEIRFRRSAEAEAGYAYIGSESRAASGTDGFGDLGYLDADGYLYVADRRTDMFTVGGSNVYPAQVEAVIEAMPDVACCAIIGLPDPDMGNLIHAIVELAPGSPTPDPENFLASAAAVLTGLTRPRSVEFTQERIRDDAGKVRRSALREARLA